jgi:serine/threonine-protein kinase
MTTGGVMAAALDGNGKLGPPKLVLEDVLVRPGGAAKATMSSNGSLVYQRGLSVSQLMLVDEHGVAAPFGIEARAFGHPHWSPDGSRIAVAIGRTGGSDIWLIDARTKSLSKLTNGTGLDDQAVWTADGKRVLYRSIESSGTKLKSIAADGSEQNGTVLSAAVDAYSGFVSHDGKWLVFRTGDLTSSYRDIFAAAMSGYPTPRALVKSPSSEANPALSPDDRWLAYVSDVSGRPEVYVRPFLGPGQPVQISRDGGNEEIWSRDGRTIYYRAGRTMTAATVSESPLAVVATRPVFTGVYLTDGGFTDYDLSPDGKHFLMLQSVDRQAETILVYNWAAELRKGWR